VELHAIKLVVPCNPDRPCMGPIPVLFTRDEDKTKQELTDKPELLYPGKNTKTIRAKDRKFYLMQG
jgi:hypothetical protein